MGWVRHKFPSNTMYRFKVNTDDATGSWKKRMDLHKIQEFVRNKRITSRPKFNWEKCVTGRLKMADRFHRAARDGYLDLLREATRKDCDKPDEDGMTPTAWAAYHGNLDALRLIVARGGNPDKADYVGNTAMHCAAGNGHMNCVTFLVNFGANIWALDNDFHTPLDIAAINEHMEIVRYLDTVVAKQSALNKRVVKKLKEKAILDAQKRVKLYMKMQEKAQKRAMKEDKKIKKIDQQLETMTTSPSVSSSGTSLRKGLHRNSLPSLHVNNNESTNTLIKSGRPSSVYNQSRPYSDHFAPSSSNKRNSGMIMKKIQKRKGDGSEFKVSESDRRSVRSLKGLQRGSEVLYVKENGVQNDLFDARSAISKAHSEPDFQYSNGDSGIVSYDSQPHESASLFERPGLGSIAFFTRHNLLATGAMMSLPHTADEEDTVDSGKGVSPSSSGEKTNHLYQRNQSRHQVNGHGPRRRNSLTDSIGTLGSLAHRMKELPWDEDEVESLDDDAEVNESSPIELFLASYGLTEFISVFTKEKIDLQALLLCSDSDLKDIGVPLGPRRKILDAAQKRKFVLKSPDVIQDSYL